ncbi:MAG: YegS/Rv2252/BmrU family lipid kinase [Defluviitaleaceae bacterium]|nr:YegS/Rv2252/BmrU family lipid kinase [Defluviitaleaceae bacterium]
MKKIRLVYNPHSGDRRFKETVDSCAEIFLGAGYLTHIVRIVDGETMNAAICDLAHDDTLVIAGGDGSVNMAINAMKRHKKNSPLGIIPAGTANDFASFLDMPKDPLDAAEVLAYGKLISADLGCANGHFFNNVCGGGLFINVSHSMNTDFKSIFGKLAYYIKGLGQLPNIAPLPLKITTESATHEDDFALFLALNSGSCGGFNKLAPNASISDGLLDFIAFRSMAMKDIAGLFLKLLTGEHLNDPRVLFSHESSIKIEYLGKDNIDTDIDGEPGPKMPIEIFCEKGAIDLVVPRWYK